MTPYAQLGVTRVLHSPEDLLHDIARPMGIGTNLQTFAEVIMYMHTPEQNHK